MNPGRDAGRKTGACVIDGVTKSFGALRAVDRVSVTVERGSLTCLIGPNGAGKSTLLLCVAGFLRPDCGRVLLDDADVSGWAPHRRARAGLGTVFQTTQAPHGLDVASATMIGCHAWTRCGFLAGIVRPPRQWREEREIRESAREALELVGLGERVDDPADSLPLGQLRLLSVARVLAQRPKVLLLDEPVAGLREAEKAQLRAVFEGLRERGLTQVIIEHDMQFVGAVAERVVVLDQGGVLADGPPAQVRDDARVVEAYLGRATL